MRKLPIGLVQLVYTADDISPSQPKLGSSPDSGQIQPFKSSDFQLQIVEGGFYFLQASLCNMRVNFGRFGTLMPK